MEPTFCNFPQAHTDDLVFFLTYVRPKDKTCVSDNPTNLQNDKRPCNNEGPPDCD